jgi:hypothetical protein
MSESATSNLDAKLISNLGQAYEIREFLKEDLFILPQFNVSASKVSSSSGDPHKVTNSCSNRQSLRFNDMK